MLVEGQSQNVCLRETTTTTLLLMQQQQQQQQQQHCINDLAHSVSGHSPANLSFGGHLTPILSLDPLFSASRKVKYRQNSWRRQNSNSSSDTFKTTTTTATVVKGAAAAFPAVVPIRKQQQSMLSTGELRRTRSLFQRERERERERESRESEM